MPEVAECFLRPLPLSSREDTLKKLTEGSSNFGTATLAVYRPMSIGLCVVWLLYLVDLYFHMLERITNSGRWYLFGFWGMFVFFALLTGLSRVIDKQRVYQLTYLATSVAYSAVLVIHVAWLWLSGDSPLIDLCLGDFVGIPVIMLATAMRGRWVIALAMALAAVSAVTNYNLIGASKFESALGAANSMLLMVPFIVFLNSGVENHDGRRSPRGALPSAFHPQRPAGDTQ
ncbi:hypothetical protein [Corynebacterium vitaeruminis]|uniref:hypothetical protein n=1 Tax=Corynebacterium vitaeruminis TaxID=38305 RepID=UPI000556014F|nr:hypothetical protein [Corynebacterium vitaeruminis]